MSNIEDAKAFIEKAAGYGSILGLSTISELLKKLNNPQDDLDIIHVAGTNGKGSTCCFLRNILSQAGYKVGVYTSPAVFCEYERYKINDIDISENDYYENILRIKVCCEEMVDEGLAYPTIFEIETALAFLYFKEQKVDYMICEVGMGGLEDATNVIDESLCSVFASIGRDHMQFLGDSVTEIAQVKAGIMKNGGNAVSIWQEDEVVEVLCKKAEELKVNLNICQREKLKINSYNPICFDYKDYKDVKLKMIGDYQIDNAVLTLEVVNKLQDLGVKISNKNIYDGLNKAMWPGRMELICENPTVYIDGAHNYPAAVKLLDTIKDNFTNKTITYIIGVLGDKERIKMLETLLPYGKDIITVTPLNARGYAGESLANDIKSMGYDAIYASSFQEAYDVSKNLKNDIILALGSLSYLKDFKDVIRSIDV